MIGVFTDTSAKVGGAERSLKNWFSGQEGIKVFSSNAEKILKIGSLKYDNSINYEFKWYYWWRIFKQVEKDIKKHDIKKALINPNLGPVCCSATRNVPKKIMNFNIDPEFIKKHANPLISVIIIKCLKKICSLSDLIITPSDRMKKLLLNDEWHKKVEVISPGVDTELFKKDVKKRKVVRDKLSVKPDELLLLDVARLNNDKNHEELIKAVNGLENVKLLLIGQGKKESYLRRIAGNNVIFHGFVEHEELPGYFNAADLFVHPSRIEALGLSMAEAMSCELPVISNPSFGSMELINDCGVISRNLRKDIITLGSDKKQRRLLGRKARKKILEFHDVRKARKKLNKLLNKL